MEGVSSVDGKSWREAQRRGSQRDVKRDGYWYLAPIHHLAK